MSQKRKSKSFLVTPSKIRRELEESDSDSDASFDLSDDDSVNDPSYDPFLGFGNKELDDTNNELQQELNDAIQELIISEDEDETVVDIEATVVANPVWSDFSNRQRQFPFTGKHDLQVVIPENITPIEALYHFINDDIFTMIVEQTNLYAKQEIAKRKKENAKKPLKPNSMMLKWADTTEAEVKMFLGLLMWMGLKKCGSIDEYWADDLLFTSPITSKGKTLSRNRFQVMLNCCHFSDNEKARKSDRLAKIQPLVDILIINFQRVYVPGSDVVIDETLVPWRGMLRFRQYIPNKAHKYGIKVFKLCSVTGFTYNLSVYSGKSETGEREVGLAKKVCEKLMSGLLNEGRTLYVDNFYTSYELAENFLKKNTHVVGTVRASKKKMPKEVMEKKLKKGEMISKEDENGIVMIKWKDTIDVRILSTKHKPIMVEVPPKPRVIQWDDDDDNDLAVAGPSNTEEGQSGTRGRRRKEREVKRKPEAILAYNRGKSGIDHADQMASYGTTLRKGVKWYRKLGIELLLGVAVVNAHVVYQAATGQTIKIREFRKSIARSLLGCENKEEFLKIEEPKQMHVLETKISEKTGEIMRTSCKLCYARLAKERGSRAAKEKYQKSIYYCSGCEGSPYMCVPCFTNKHKKMPLE